MVKRLHYNSIDELHFIKSCSIFKTTWFHLLGSNCLFLARHQVKSLLMSTVGMLGITCRGLTRLQSPADTHWTSLSLSCRTWEESESLCFYLCCVFDCKCSPCACSASVGLCLIFLHPSVIACCACMCENCFLFILWLTAWADCNVLLLSDSGKSVSRFCCCLVHIVARLKNYSGRRPFMKWYNDVRYTNR